MRGVKIGLRLDFLKKRKEFELFTLLIFFIQIKSIKADIIFGLVNQVFILT